MKKIHLSFFLFFFILISFVEGVHFILDLRFLTFFLYCVPLVLFMLDEKKSYSLPKPLAFLGIIYLLSSFISVFYSYEIGTSLELFFRDVSLFLICIYAHTHTSEIKRYLPPILIWISLSFVFISGILLLFPEGRLFIQGQRLNLLYNPAYLHKTIGDFLTIGIIICVHQFCIEKKKRYLIPLIVFLTIFLLSFSRTAYIVGLFSLFFSVVIYRFQMKKIQPILGFSLFLNIVLVLVLFLTFTSHTGISILNYLQYDVLKNFNINVRSLADSHFPYWLIGARGLFLAPFTGVGAGIYQYLSYRFTEFTFLPSNTSFNLFLDIAAGQGIVASIGFISMVFFVLVKAEKKSVFFLLFIALCMGFMGYPTFLYLQIVLLFYILMGVVTPTDPVEFKIPPKWYLSLSILLIVFINIVFIHDILIQAGKRELAQKLYPYDRENIQSLINQSLPFLPRKNTQIKPYMIQYERFFGANAFDLENIGDTYAQMGGVYKLDAIYAYEKSFTWGKFTYGGSMIKRMAKLYALKKQMQGEKEAKRYIIYFLEEYRTLLNKDSKSIQEEIYNTLKKTYLL